MRNHHATNFTKPLSSHKITAKNLLYHPQKNQDRETRPNCSSILVFNVTQPACNDGDFRNDFFPANIAEIETSLSPTNKLNSEIQDLSSEQSKSILYLFQSEVQILSKQLMIRVVNKQTPDATRMLRVVDVLK
jgi:hypothetical protein